MSINIYFDSKIDFIHSESRRGYICWVLENYFSRSKSDVHQSIQKQNNNEKKRKYF